VALAIDASSPATATANTGAATQTATTASFTPPANSLLVVLAALDATASGTPAATVTDNLGGHLTYTQRVFSNRGDSPVADGAAIIWTAPVVTSSAMTVSVANTGGGIASDLAVRVMVITDGSGATPGVGAVAKVASTSTTSLAASYTATGTNSWGFAVANDWKATGSMTAGGTGNTLTDTGTFAGNISYGFVRRTTPDGVGGVTTTLTLNPGASSTAMHLAAVEILVPTSATDSNQYRQDRLLRWQIPWQRFKSTAEMLADPTVIIPSAPVNPDWVPTTTTRRRTVRRVPILRINSGTDIPDGNTLLPPSIRRGGYRVRRKPPVTVRGGVFEPPDSSIPSRVYVRRRPGRIPRLFSGGDVFMAPPTQVAAPTNPTITQAVVSRARRLGQLPRRATAPGPVPAQLVVQAPTITQRTSGRVQRRAQGRNRPSAVPGAPLAGQGVVPGPTTRLRVRPSARWRRGATPTPAQQAIVSNPSITATVFGRLRSVGRIRPPSRITNPTPAQQAAATNPRITQTVYGRLRAVGRIRPPSRVTNPTPAQQVTVSNPTITATVFGRLRAVGRINARARTNNPPSAQFMPVSPRRPRPINLGQRRGRVGNPTPAQQATVPNPSITATVFGRLRAVGRIRPPLRVTNPTPAQQTAAPNPRITHTAFGRLRSVGRTNRTRRIIKPIPTQVNPPYPVRPSRVVAMRGIFRRRGQSVSAAQVQPTAETRTGPAGGLRGLRRVWLKIRRKNVTPIPAQVTTLQGPLIITDSHGGVEADRNAGTATGGVYSSSGSSTVTKGSTGTFTADPDTDNVVGTYDSDSDTL
jgi:hypothetical protein